MYANYPRKHRSQYENSTSKRKIFASTRELIGIISAGTGIFIALLYLAGRSFASGYFSAMNIPNYQVGFSLWEYGEVAWLPMIIYPTVIIGLDGLIYGLILTVFSWWVFPLIKRLFGWLRKLLRIKIPTWQLPEVHKEAKRWFALVAIAFLVLLFVSIVALTLQFVNGYGAYLGQSNVLENVPQVELVSTSPMTLDGGNAVNYQMGDDQSQYYKYEGFHLLVFNNGKYYLFKDINPATCRPNQVFIINDDANVQVRLLPALSLTRQCKKGWAK